MITPQQEAALDDARKSLYIAIEAMKNAKTNNISEEARRMAIIIMELQKAEALLQAWFPFTPY